MPFIYRLPKPLRYFLYLFGNLWALPMTLWALWQLRGSGATFWGIREGAIELIEGKESRDEIRRSGEDWYAETHGTIVIYMSRRAAKSRSVIRHEHCHVRQHMLYGPFSWWINDSETERCKAANLDPSFHSTFELEAFAAEKLDFPGLD